MEVGSEDCSSVKDQEGSIGHISLTGTSQMDERKTGWRMPVAYIHTFAFFFKGGKMQFSVGCGGLRKGDGEPGAKIKWGPTKDFMRWIGKNLKAKLELP